MLSFTEMLMIIILNVDFFSGEPALRYHASISKSDAAFYLRIFYYIQGIVRCNDVK